MAYSVWLDLAQTELIRKFGDSIGGLINQAVSSYVRNPPRTRVWTRRIEGSVAYTWYTDSIEMRRVGMTIEENEQCANKHDLVIGGNVSEVAREELRESSYLSHSNS